MTNSQTKTELTNEKIEQYIEEYAQGYDVGVPTPNIKDIMGMITTLIHQAEITAQTNGVAWAIGVIDDLHIGVNMGSSINDKIFKGIKNTIRDRYKLATGIDPAPNYPIKATLIETLEKEIVL